MYSQDSTHVYNGSLRLPVHSALRTRSPRVTQLAVWLTGGGGVIRFIEYIFHIHPIALAR